MINADAIVIEFIGNNIFTLTLLIGFLKILAQRSETNLDDSIIGYFGQAITKKKPAEPAPK